MTKNYQQDDDLDEKEATKWNSGDDDGVDLGSGEASRKPKKALLDEDEANEDEEFSADDDDSDLDDELDDEEII
jgi:hypothetical protein